AAAEIEPTVGEMQVAVADARREHFEQHLAASWLWRRLLLELQRLAADAELKHAHGSPFGSFDEPDCGTKILRRRKDVPIAGSREIRKLTQSFACNRQGSEMRTIFWMRRGQAESSLKRLRASQHNGAGSGLKRCDGRIFADRLCCGDGLDEAGKIGRGFGDD